MQQVEKTAYDLATLFRVLPWLLMGDQRDLTALVRRALADSKGFISSADRRGLMRGLAQNLLEPFGQKVEPTSLNALVYDITRQVDELLAEQQDPFGLGADIIDVGVPEVETTALPPPGEQK